MIQVNIHEAKTQLSRLIAQVVRGEEVVIARAGEPVVRLVRFESSPKRARRLGRDAGLFTVPDDFDAPLPDDVIREFTSPEGSERDPDA